MSAATIREAWRRASLAYYYKITATRKGRARLAEYKRYRRRCIRNGLWPTIKNRKARA